MEKKIETTIMFNSQSLLDISKNKNHLFKMIGIIKRSKKIMEPHYTLEFIQDERATINSLLEQTYKNVVRISRVLGGYYQKITVALPENFCEAHREYYASITSQRGYVFCKINKKTFLNHLINYIRKNPGCVIEKE